LAALRSSSLGALASGDRDATAVAVAAVAAAPPSASSLADDDDDDDDDAMRPCSHWSTLRRVKVRGFVEEEEEEEARSEGRKALAPHLGSGAAESKGKRAARPAMAAASGALPNMATPSSHGEAASGE
jgi:hypothetical protein